MWVSRFEWPSTVQATCQTNLNTHMQNMADHGFTAAVVGVRGECDTLYPSPYEPWSTLISADGLDPGWTIDPLEYAITAAHTRGLQFCAQFNTHVSWQSGAEVPPSAAGHSNHIHFQHCNASDPAHRDWLIHDAAGNPVQFASDSHVWLAPGVPAMQAHLRQQVMHVVENCDIDGIMYDRIRTSSQAYSHDPISMARWDDAGTPAPNDGPGNPAGLGFDDWTIDQITRFTNDLCAQVLAARSDVAVAASVFGLHAHSDYPIGYSGFTMGVENWHQDGVLWMQRGSVDFVSPMIHWDIPDPAPNFGVILPPWMTAATAANRQIAPSLAASKCGPNPELRDEVTLSRSQGALGTFPFSISSLDAGEMDYHLANINTPAAPAPTTADFPWRQTEGVILGHVYEVNGTTPVVDAWVTRTGSTWTALSSGDGLFAFLRVPPGSYTVTAQHPTLGTISASAEVTAGAVRSIALSLPLPAQLTVLGQD